MRWYSDCWSERRSVPGESRLCSSLVNKRATLSKAILGDSAGNVDTAMVEIMKLLELFTDDVANSLEAVAVDSA